MYPNNGGGGYSYNPHHHDRYAYHNNEGGGHANGGEGDVDVAAIPRPDYRNNNHNHTMMEWQPLQFMHEPSPLGIVGVGVGIEGPQGETVPGPEESELSVPPPQEQQLQHVPEEPTTQQQQPQQQPTTANIIHQHHHHHQATTAVMTTTDEPMQVPIIKNSGGGSDATYVLRIHEMLEDAEKEGHTHIVSWQPHGRAFKVHKEPAFVDTIMPRYFKAKIGSFRRWLRAWGFCRMTEGQDRGAWYHRYFVRGVTELCKNMTRHQMLHAMDDWLPAGQVPDFYQAATGAVLSESSSSTLQQQPLGTTTLPASAVQSSTPFAKNPKKLRGTILEDLRAMLQAAEEEGNNSIVSWMSHGRAFKVHSKLEFAQHIMPRYFKTQKVTHFSDTLRIWGFCRLKKGIDKGAYFHKYFVRHQVSLSRHQSRLQMKKAMEGFPLPSGEPNLYAPERKEEPVIMTMTTNNDLPPPPALAVSQTLPHHPDTNMIPLTVEQPTLTASPPQQDNHDSTAAAAHPPAPLSPPVEETSPLPQMTYPPRALDPNTVHIPQQPHHHHLMEHPHQHHEQHHHPQQHHHQHHQQEHQPVPIYYHDPNYIPHPTIVTCPVPPVVAAAPAPTYTAEDIKGASDGTYVLRIHEMLEDAEKEGNQKIVSWQPHGRAFKVHNETEFVDKIMPRYFKAKIGSFRRWLRAWGFCRMTEGRDRGAWYHRYFVRGVTELCRNMTRHQMLKAMDHWLPAGQVPDFYVPGTGAVLSESSAAAAPRRENVQFAKNPKKLRGTVPEDLRNMLQDAETEGTQTVVSWLPHGRAFKVHIKQEFVSKIMSRYFKATKFTYFSDTLRIWGFCRLKSGNDKGAYYHRYFVRGSPSLSRHLSRVQMKQAMAGFPPPGGEPNLYMTDAPDLSPQQQQQVLLPAGPKEADDLKPSPILATPPHETTAPHHTDTDMPTNNLQELEDFSIHNTNLDVERKGGDNWDDSVAEI